MPVHYAYEPPYIYVYTTEGKKSEILARNPRVCLQIEEVKDNRDWKSVIVQGEAEQLMDESDRTRALEAVLKVNPSLTPAVSIHWMDSWVRENIEVIYRIVPLEMSGRASVAKSDSRAPFVPQRKVG
jgi:nitroimidazol reductase NimA-like FMN-containing flavoprotein (pyridoxamine 5'-phosphate oxidase superfamily)